MATGKINSPQTSKSSVELQEIQELFERLRKMEPKIFDPDRRSRDLPDTLHSFLSALLENLKRGDAVTLLKNDTPLTTIEASKLLGMSRQFLVGLLEKNEIPHHMVGTHRRMYLRDVLIYKAKRDTVRRKAIDDLARAESDEGIYGRVPDDFHAGR
jgi:excisionase family DNA binding protein